MKRAALLILLLPWLMTCSGCRSKNDTIDWQADVHLKEKDGWKYERLYGSPGSSDEIAFEVYSESDNAKTLTGYWVENGEVHTNEYKQDSRLYYLLVFQKTNGDTFLAVLSRDKTKSK